MAPPTAVVRPENQASIPASDASMAWIRLRSKALMLELWRDSATTVMLKNSTTSDTSRAVTMAMPRSSLRRLIIEEDLRLVGWDRRAHVAGISVLGVAARDRRL